MHNALLGKPALLLAVAACAAGGCGNTDEPAAPEAPTTASPRAPLSKAEYVRASGEICRRAEEALRAFIPLGSDPTTRRANRSGIIGVIRRQAEELEALGTPAGAPARPFEETYRAVEATLDRAERDGTTDIEREIDEAISPHGDVLAEYSPGC